MNALSVGCRLLGIGGEPLLLASASPRRRLLIEMLGIPCVSRGTSVAEGNRGPGESPGAYVERLAREKALDLVADGSYAVLGADTIVQLGEETLEKPRDRDHARELLTSLSGRWHEVYTGICLRRVRDGRMAMGHERSRVLFAQLDPPLIELYLETREHEDKAGAYGIQGYGALLVDRIEGCYFNVMGLPLARLRRLALELEESS